MVDKDDVENFIAHYASDVYDPAKAHEYYLKNRELTGRKSTKGMSDVQKEAVAYSKNQIGIKKKADLGSAQATQKARMDNIRKRTEQSRAKIQSQLKSAIDKLSADANVKAAPVTLNAIPVNATPKVRAYLERQNASMSNDANKKHAKTSAEAHQKSAVAIAAAQKKAHEDIQKLATGMKAAVSSARAAYLASRNQTVSKYDKATATEMDNIRTKLPGLPPKVVKPKQARAITKKPRRKKGEPSK